MKDQTIVLILFSFLISFLITGCWTANKEIVRPEIPATIVRPVIQPAPGSIWRGETDKNMLFIDKKARYVNDIVTIIVAESVQGQNKAATGTSRDSTASASIDAFLGIENSIINNNSNMGGQIALGGKSANALKGSGDTSRNTSLVARISARVVHVLDNGNLVIEGRRQVTVNAEDQYLMISGIVRPQDITADNTVASQYVSDARIVYTGEGVVNDKMRPGWMTRVVDWVWPF